MTVLEIYFIIIVFGYILQALVLILGLYKATYTPNTSNEPSVSVVVAARNEEQNIAVWLSSLVQSDYPREKFEIIVVNDHSTDATENIVQQFTQQYSFIKLIQAQHGNGNLQGKANAIAQGVDVSQSDIVMMTDADCTVHPQWVRRTTHYFAEDTGVVAGFTILNVRSWFSGMQSLDLAYILAIAVAAMGIHLPLSCIGNNFSFRRKAYNEVGGYRNIPFSVTEDFALFKAIVKKGKWQYRYPVEHETLVTSNPVDSVKDLYRQKRRWAVGGKEIQPLGVMLFIVGISMHSLMLIGFSLGIQSAMLLAGIAIKCACDYVLLYIPLKKIKREQQLKYFFLFQFYFILYVILLPLAVFFGGRVVWKGRKF